MNPQEALDAPRFCIVPSAQNTPGVEQALDKGCVGLEDGIPAGTVAELRALRHEVTEPVTGHERGLFGRGQIIASRSVDGGRRVLWAGSDGRGDGLAIGY